MKDRLISQRKLRNISGSIPHHKLPAFCVAKHIVKPKNKSRVIVGERYITL